MVLLKILKDLRLDISQLVREDGLYIIDGIRRVEALKHLGYVECPLKYYMG